MSNSAQPPRCACLYSARRGRLIGFWTFLAALTMVAFPALLHASTVQIAWEPNKESDLSGYIVFFGTRSGNYTGSVDVGPATSALMNVTDTSSTYYFAVAAYSTSGMRSPLSAEVSWSIAAPSLTNPGSQTNTVGQNVSLQLRATDPAGLSLTYAASGLPAGLAIGFATGLVSGVPSTAGAYPVTVSATNKAGAAATQLFTWSILTQPAVTLTNPGSQTTTVGQNVALQLRATDPAGLSVTYAASGLPTGLAIATANGAIFGIPSATGTYTVTATAVSASGAKATQVFTWTVLPLPAITPISDTTPTIPGIAPPPGITPPTISDTTPPTISITSPTSAGTYNTDKPTVALEGGVFDDVSVVSVGWKNDRGGQGEATFSGAAWSVPSIDLKNGPNLLTVTAVDGEGNTATDTLTMIVKINKK